MPRPTLRPTPLWMVRTARDHRPALLQLPAAAQWFETPSGPGCWHDGVAWLPVTDRVVALPLPGPVHVLARGVLQGADGAVADVRGRRLALSAPGVRGADLAVSRAASGWSCRDLPLPEGARRSRRLHAFATGRGVLWCDGGWLYRLRAGEAPRAVGPLGGEPLLPGPDGAVLVGDGGRWTRVAGPRSAMHPLEAPLLAEAPVRFSRTGHRLCGVSTDGDAVVVDTGTGGMRVRRAGALPLTDRAFVEAGAPDVPGEALLASPPVFRGGLLGGPGGRIWDLDAGRAVPDALLGPGPHAACDGRWATYDGDGLVRWLEPRTGSDLAEVSLPLLPGEEPVAAWGVERTAVFATSHGRRLAVGRDHPVPVPPGEPPAPPWSPSPAQWAALGFEATLHRGGRTWLFSPAGHLAAVADATRPAGGPGPR